jgi:uncharacterized repeat protein (TIGR03803 family)
MHAHDRVPALVATAVLTLAGSASAFAADFYDPVANRLTIPTMTVGSAVYSDVVVSVGGVVTPPLGTTPVGSNDGYDPATKLLTIPEVISGNTVYYNLVVSVSGLQSIGSVVGADTFDGANLNVGAVQVLGGAAYQDVTISVGKIISLGGGMPAAGLDTYDPLSHQLTIAAVQVGGRVFTNAVIVPGAIRSLGGTLPLETVVHSFANGSVTTDGSAPTSLIQGSDGDLYGLTGAGGTRGAGTFFRLTPGGVETVLYSFGGNPDGLYPVGNLVEGSDGTFYGVTDGGGAHNLGTVFSVTRAGVETVLYSFGADSSDGSYPVGLVLGKDGNFYGNTWRGGVNHIGTVFQVTSTGTEAVLHSFGTGTDSDGAYPVGTLTQGLDGNFYGVTRSGGVHGAGAVFVLTPAGQEAVLYSFANDGYPFGGYDGNSPSTGLVQLGDGSFYGATGSGGENNVGTVFRITTAGIETVVYSFGQPTGSLGAGVFFSLTPTGTELARYVFGSNGVLDGSQPSAGLIQASDGSFYGTTQAGGANGGGTVFHLTNVVPKP